MIVSVSYVEFKYEIVTKTRIDLVIIGNVQKCYTYTCCITFLY